MKRRTRQQWYQHHLAMAQEAARESVVAVYSEEIDGLRQLLEVTSEAVTNARQNEPIKSRLLALVGVKTPYRRDVLAPVLMDQAVVSRALSDALERRRLELKEATCQGTERYLEARELRRQEMDARAQRVAQRKYERRLRYLEQSPAIRSAGRPLKEHLINEQSEDGLSVSCFYCSVIIPAGEAHLEHKRPLSRGGTNSRGNLVLSCAPCNLRKARKTSEEFMRGLGGAS